MLYVSVTPFAELCQASVTAVWDELSFGGGMVCVTVADVAFAKAQTTRRRQTPGFGTGQLSKGGTREPMVPNSVGPSWIQIDPYRPTGTYPGNNSSSN